MNKKQLSQFIKEERKKLGLTQEMLAGKCKCRRQAIIELEKNQCDTGFSLIATVLKNLGYKLRPVQSGTTVSPDHPKSSAPPRFDFSRGRDKPSTSIDLEDDFEW
jgi:DNA-binding XRE family transcriptional regulator